MRSVSERRSGKIIKAYYVQDSVSNSKQPFPVRRLRCEDFDARLGSASRPMPAYGKPLSAISARCEDRSYKLLRKEQSVISSEARDRETTRDGPSSATFARMCRSLPEADTSGQIRLSGCCASAVSIVLQKASKVPGFCKGFMNKKMMR
jgi:hypothetical protein